MYISIDDIGGKNIEKRKRIRIFIAKASFCIKLQIKNFIVIKNLLKT
jgi:hypothetical protein